MTLTTITTSADLQRAYEGSWYTIAGVGGDPAEWVEGYEEMMRERGLSAPTEWFATTGALVNLYALQAGEVRDNDRFPDDLVLLLFPLDGLDVPRLAPFKVQMQDRWFDDVIQNMRRS